MLWVADNIATTDIKAHSRIYKIFIMIWKIPYVHSYSCMWKTMLMLLVLMIWLLHTPQKPRFIVVVYLWKHEWWKGLLQSPKTLPFFKFFLIFFSKNLSFSISTIPFITQVSFHTLNYFWTNLVANEFETFLKDDTHIQFQNNWNLPNKRCLNLIPKEFKTF